MTRVVPRVLLLVAVLVLAVLDVAWGQSPEGMDRLGAEERAIVQRNLERWQKLAPDERQRVLENYRQWKSMSPQDRESARDNFKRFRQMTPATMRR